MKKNIIIGLLITVSLLSLTYGLYQKVRADRIEENTSKKLHLKEEYIKNIQRIIKEAENNAFEAKKQKLIAEKQEEIAEQQRQMVEMQKKIAEENKTEAIKQKRIAEKMEREMMNALVEAKRAYDAAEKKYKENQNK